MDLRVPEGRRAFEQLVTTADVVYENNVSETMEKLAHGIKQKLKDQ